MNKPDGREDEDCHPMAETASGLNRRGLLGAAAGGFALAASGLFLPEFLDEAEAREGANGGKLGGRHGKNGRGRDRHRDHGAKKAKRDDHGERKDEPEDPPRGRVGIRGIQFNVNNTRSAPMKVEFRDWKGVILGWPLVTTETVSNLATFQTAESNAYLWIADYIYIQAENHTLWWPQLTMGYGGKVYVGDSWHLDGAWKDGTKVVNAQEMGEGSSGPQMQTDRGTVRVNRLKDTDYIAFQVDIL